MTCVTNIIFYLRTEFKKVTSTKKIYTFRFCVNSHTSFQVYFLKNVTYSLISYIGTQQYLQVKGLFIGKLI